MRSATSLRVFVAVEIPPRELALIGDLAGHLRSFGARIAWVPAANVHVTLAFLGDIECDRVGSVTAAVTEGCDMVRPFELSVLGTGSFPASSRAKVLWAGVSGHLDILQALRRRVTDALRREEFNLDDKPFRPHLTIGRVKDGRGPEFASVLRELGSATLTSKPFVVDSVTVIRSELLPSGARYSPLARIGLAGNAS